MSTIIPDLFAEVTVRLEDLHAMAVEGQRADNAPDMQSVLSGQLRFGVVALNGILREMARTLEGSFS